MKKISIIGLGYAGLSNALLLSKQNQVFAIDTNLDKVEKINNNHSSIEDLEFEEYLKENDLHLSAILKSNCLKNLLESNYVLLSEETACSAEKIDVSVSVIEDDIDYLYKNKYNGTIVINTNVPIGFTDEMIDKYKPLKIIYVPDLSKYTKSLQAILTSERIIVGAKTKQNLNAEEFLHILSDAINGTASLHLVTTREAEAIKLFSYA